MELIDEEIDKIMVEKLLPIHNKLINFSPYSALKQEIPEQLMTCKLIRENDNILELGGSIGRNSCVINSILKNKNKHVVIEPSIIEANKLIINRDQNKLDYQIEISAISSHRLYSKGWLTYKENVSGAKEINIINYNDLYNKYNIPFNVLIIDNEGNFVDMLKSFPNILDNIRLLIIEHDFNSESDLDYFNQTLKKNNFTMTTKYMKNAKYGPGMNWSDGIISDPIFVSGWERE